MSAAVQSSTGNPSLAIYAALNGARESGSGELSPQDRFLKLLVTQLKNQDPLNPMDNAQMTSQMAQISTVDGIEKLNATLKMILEGSNQNQAMQAAALVGHGVMVPGSGLALEGGMAIGGVELAEAADRVSIVVKDASGIAVKTIELGGRAAGSHGFAWDGTTDAGTQAAGGAYTIAVTAQRGDAKVGATALQMGVVTSVARTGDSISLNIGTLGAFRMSDVRQIL